MSHCGRAGCVCGRRDCSWLSANAAEAASDGVGPWQFIETAIPRSGWTLVREEVPQYNDVRWSVYLRYETGARVPPGPNHVTLDEVEAEAERLQRLVDAS